MGACCVEHMHNNYKQADEMLEWNVKEFKIAQSTICGKLCATVLVTCASDEKACSCTSCESKPCFQLVMHVVRLLLEGPMIEGLS